MNRDKKNKHPPQNMIFNTLTLEVKVLDHKHQRA